MFDKEASEYAKENKKVYGSDEYAYITDYNNVKKTFQEAAEFGYNKANEWHFVKDGDLPKGNGLFVIYWKLGDIDNYMIFRGTIGDLHKDTIAWKELIPPKESE